MGTGFDVEENCSYSAISKAQGIIPRAVHYLFAKIQERIKEAGDAGHPSPDFKVSAQFVELYNEEIFDLIDPEAKVIFWKCVENLISFYGKVKFI